MNNLSILNNQVLTMSSREIAELTGKRHDNVLSDIRNMLTEIQSPEKLGDYKDGRGRSQPMLLLDKEESLCLVAGYNVKLRMAIIKRWQELESQQAQQIPQTYAAALLEAGRLALAVEEKDKQLEIAAPKVAFVDNYVESSGGKTFREIAKLLKANERQFRSFMVANKIQYILNGSWAAYQNHIEAGRFTHKTGEKNGHAYSECRFTPKGIQWISDLWEKHKEMKQAKLDKPLE